MTGSLNIKLRGVIFNFLEIGIVSGSKRDGWHNNNNALGITLHLKVSTYVIYILKLVYFPQFRLPLSALDAGVQIFGTELKTLKTR